MRSLLARVLVASVLAALVPGVQTSVSARPSGKPPAPVVTLRGRTVVRATSSGLVKLRVPEDVALIETRAALAGDGRVVGYALTNEGHTGQGAGRVVVNQFVFNGCTDPGCKPTRKSMPTRWSSGLRNGVIPAGTYDLYVVADEAPATITFKNRYLGGKSSVHSVAPAGIEIATLPMSKTSTSDGTSYSGGSFTSLEDGPGIGVLGLWSLGTPHAVTAFGDCFYFTRELEDHPEAAFVPGCPTSFSPRPLVAPNTSPGSEGGAVYKSTHFRLPTAIGGWATSAARVESFGAVGLWVRF